MQKHFLKKLVSGSVGILKVNDENRRIQIISQRHPRIRIHTKMSWIRNTASEETYVTYAGNCVDLNLHYPKGLSSTKVYYKQL